MNNEKNNEIEYLIQSLELDIEIINQRIKEKIQILESLKLIEESFNDIE